MMMILFGLATSLALLVLYAILGALGFRWAGGLLSQWVGVDLGDQFPRLLWGWLACLPLFVAFAHDFPSVLIISLTACLTGLMRGVGWGNSLTLGFETFGKPTHQTPHKLLVMFSRLALMEALPFISAGYFVRDHSLWLVIPLLSTLFIASCLTSLMGYYQAWMHKGLYIPLLGCDPNDPPPTGELFTGASTEFFLGLGVMILT